MVSVVVGGHFGDEGKGKIISYLALHDNPEVIARAGVGPNAGHTVYKNGKKYGLRMVPCGFVNDNARLLIGAGVLVDVQTLLKEIGETNTGNRIGLDKRCAIIEERHKEQDVGDKHLKSTVGSTGTGCGPANAERAHRTIKLAQDIPSLKGFLADVPEELNRAFLEGKKILVEGTQGFCLSLFYGTYPYVTSKDTTASMVAADVGIGPTKIKKVYVVFKAYMSRVGQGPFETELDDKRVKASMWKKILEAANAKGIKGRNPNETIAEYFGEKGTVTGRMRRIGDFDFKLARYSAMVNSATDLAVTCIDKLFPECGKVKKYDDLSQQARDYLKKIEDEVGVKITLISTGPDAEDIIDLRQQDSTI
ncbi:MAG: adenylosuccinate synthetase [Candidatus Altiarchaeales archaeon]|nr:adenylosuccinate synthetase [Candidatus Altiarchaeales archaeon]